MLVIDERYPSLCQLKRCNELNGWNCAVQRKPSIDQMSTPATPRTVCDAIRRLRFWEDA